MPPAAAAQVAIQPIAAGGAPGAGPAVAAGVAAGAAALAALAAGSQVPVGNQGWPLAGPAVAAGASQGAATAAAAGSAAMAVAAADLAVAEAARQAALAAMAAAGAGAQGLVPGPIGIKRAWSLGRQRQPDIREYGQASTRGRTGFQQAPGIPIRALPGPTGTPVPQLPQVQANLLENFGFPRGHVGMVVGSGLDEARSRSGRSASR